VYIIEERTSTSRTILAVEVLRSYTIPEEKAEYVVPSTSQVPDTSMDVDVNLDPQLAGPANVQLPPEAHVTPGATMKSNLRLFPPPLFSRQTIPQGYKYAFHISISSH
jgi:general transcription factor 3C polypeptide 5 (transcription factor C subunit 1)